MPNIPRWFPGTSVGDWTSGQFGGGDAPPGPPGTLTCPQGANDPFTEFDLAWTPGLTGSAFVTGYEIQQSTDGSNWTTHTANTGSTVTSFTVTGVPHATTRWFRVAAINAIGKGDYSNEPSGTTGAPVVYTVSGGYTVRNYIDPANSVAYTAIQWTSSGWFHPTSIPVGKTFDMMVIGGGGGGGGSGQYNNPLGSGGGGAGGLRFFTGLSLGLGQHTVTIGSGGSGGTATYPWGNTGGPGSFSEMYGTTSPFSGAVRGSGGGGGAEAVGAGHTGGSGSGGGGWSTYSGSAGNVGNYTPVEGFAGGQGAGPPYYTGGGGGGSAATGSMGGSWGSVDWGGLGGPGLQTPIARGPHTYVAGEDRFAGGGEGGGINQNTNTVNGRAYGGGSGGWTSVPGGNAIVNTGGGGSGSGYNGNGGAAGSGTIVLRWAV